MRLGVCPTRPQGRFEMIVLHLVLVLRRLAREGGEAASGWPAP